MKILLFGTGEYYQIYKEWFNQVTIVALLDNDARKQGGILDGIKIIAPTDIIYKSFDAVFLLSLHIKEMREQLLELGISAEKIFTYDDIAIILKKQLPRAEIKIWGDFRRTRKNWQDCRADIALVSHELTYTGAVIALYQVAQILVRQGLNIFLVSLCDGPMRQKFMGLNIPVLIDHNLRVCTFVDIPWIRYCRLLFVNTMTFYALFRNHCISVPIIWWIHESEMIYFGRQCELLNDKASDGVFVYTVGKYARTPFLKRCPNWSVQGGLLFGIEDFYMLNSHYQQNRFIYAVVGVVSKRKAQDLFLQAVQNIPNDIRKRCEFWIIGNNEEPWALDLSKLEIEGVRYFGTVNREQIQDIYRKINVLVCCSRSDTMPIVTVEAMMNHIPCIVSDHVGTMEFISHGVNGFTYPVMDVEKLSELMTWCYEHQNELRLIGDNARKVYESKFSLESLQGNLFKILQHSGIAIHDNYNGLIN